MDERNETSQFNPALSPRPIIPPKPRNSSQSQPPSVSSIANASHVINNGNRSKPALPPKPLLTPPPLEDKNKNIFNNNFHPVTSPPISKLQNNSFNFSPTSKSSLSHFSHLQSPHNSTSKLLHHCSHQTPSGSTNLKFYRKSASLGRNFDPSLLNSSQKNKSKILPFCHLDLSVGSELKSPPSPPPRQRKNSKIKSPPLSPVEMPTYASIDKEQKWEERRKKAESALKSATNNEQTNVREERKNETNLSLEESHIAAYLEKEAKLRDENPSSSVIKGQILKETSSLGSNLEKETSLREENSSSSRQLVKTRILEETALILLPNLGEGNPPSPSLVRSQILNETALESNLEKEKNLGEENPPSSSLVRTQILNESTSITNLEKETNLAEEKKLGEENRLCSVKTQILEYESRNSLTPDSGDDVKSFLFSKSAPIAHLSEEDFNAFFPPVNKIVENTCKDVAEDEPSSWLRRHLLKNESAKGGTSLNEALNDSLSSLINEKIMTESLVDENRTHKIGELKSTTDESMLSIEEVFEDASNEGFIIEAQNEVLIKEKLQNIVIKSDEEEDDAFEKLLESKLENNINSKSFVDGDKCDAALVSDIINSKFGSKDKKIRTVIGSAPLLLLKSSENEEGEEEEEKKRRSSWSCSEPTSLSSSFTPTSSSSSNSLRRKSQAPSISSSTWADEGDISGALGDEESSDACQSTVGSSSSSSFSRRKKLVSSLFSSFGKSGHVVIMRGAGMQGRRKEKIVVPPMSSGVTKHSLDEIPSGLSASERQAFYVAREILSSERTFVDVLNLLTVELRDAIKAESAKIGREIVSETELDSLLGGLSIMKKANENLLEALENRLSVWRTQPHLSDIIIRTGPFLKHYSTYIRDFQKIVERFERMRDKNTDFGRVVSEFEGSERCKSLLIKHYMLKPIQRMPQYALLLKDYLKNLGSESEDYEGTLKAISIVKEVAEHGNEAIRLQENAEKLIQLQSRISPNIILKPNRQLLHEGELQKVCRKELQPRYFALMSDCLFCLMYSKSASSLESRDFRVRYELPLKGMRVATPNNEDYMNEFSVISVKRSFNLVAKSSKERDQWISALKSAIQNDSKRSSGNISQPDSNAEFPAQIGKIAPVWIPDERVSMCQVCTAAFTMLFRIHHCRACGKAVCRDCSGNKAPLQYSNNEALRVCNYCYSYLLDEFDRENINSVSESVSQIRSLFKRSAPHLKNSGGRGRKSLPNRLLEAHLSSINPSSLNNPSSLLPPPPPPLHSGYLQWKEPKKGWKRQWFLLTQNVLYVQPASEDIVPTKSIPILGYTLQPHLATDNGVEGVEGKSMFKLTHSGQEPYYFQAENAASAEKWMAAMQEATVLK